MTTDQQKRLTRVQILTALGDCGQYMLPNDTLIIQVRLAMGHSQPLSEVEAILKEMEADRLIISTQSGVKEIKWMLTDLGRATLRSL